MKLLFYTTEHTEYTEVVIQKPELSVWSVYSVVKYFHKTILSISTFKFGVELETPFLYHRTH
jgi:hypothetical protein